MKLCVLVCVAHRGEDEGNFLVCGTTFVLRPLVEKASYKLVLLTFLNALAQQTVCKQYAFAFSDGVGNSQQA